ncbi:UNVERIFIED_CONTAM: hypothetical protein GTU68_033656 [Idotea baltica]|nr:hypothetical protein [Idotea baltica]
MPAGIGAALLHFMFTSKVQKSGHIGIATFIVSTLGYWSHCRYNYSVQKFNLGQLPKHLMTKEFQDERRND